MLQREIVLPVDVDALWSALTDQDKVAGWMGARVEWELVPGAPARFREEDGRQRDGRMELVEPGRRLRFRWWPVRQSGPSAQQRRIEDCEEEQSRSGEEPSGDEPSEVTYELTPVPEGTRLRVTERPLSEPRAQASAQAVGWSNWDTRLAGCWVHAARAVGAGAPIRM